MNSFYEESTDCVIGEPIHLAKGDPSWGSDDPSLRAYQEEVTKNNREWLKVLTDSG